MVSAQITGHAVDDVTALWVSKLGQKMTKKLSTVGLIAARESSTLGELVDDFIRLRKNDVKPGTMITYRNAKRHLTDFFGKDKPLNSLNAGNGKEFRAYLIGKGQAENTVRRTCGVAKTFCKLAIDKELLTKNPFDSVPSAFLPVRHRHFYITAEDIETVITEAPDDEWKLIIALARYGGLRTPSEIFSLKWSDVNWERNRFYVRSPKTERHAGKEGRFVPLFPELRKYFDQCFFDPAEDRSEYVIAKHRVKSDNLRTQFQRIITRAGLVPWPKPFQNLRSSRETELLERFPIQTVVAWLGNSPKVAMQSYLQVRESDFEKAIESDAIGTADSVRTWVTKQDKEKSEIEACSQQ
jgi:integrase